MNPGVCSVADDTCSGKIHQHHDDYARMDETRPLCSSHHRRWHTEHGRAKNWDRGNPVYLQVKVPREALELLTEIGEREYRRPTNLLSILILTFLENPSLQDCVLTHWGMFETDHAGDARRKAFAKFAAVAREELAKVRA